MITLEHVCFSYEGQPTLNDVSCTIEKGEFVAVIGANGAGKSTLTKLLNGLHRPDSGRVTVLGMDTQTTRTSVLARHIGFLFQNPDRQICQNTVREEIRFGLSCTLEEKTEIDRRTEEILDTFGFDGGQAPFSLSRGERQRLALASILAGDPEILILDEPTTGLDYRECMAMMEFIKKRNQAGTTVIMVTHDMEIVQDFCSRVLVLAGGRLLSDGAMEQVMLEDTVLQKASLLPPQIASLGLMLGGEFRGIFTIDAMAKAIASAKERGVRL